MTVSHHKDKRSLSLPLSLCLLSIKEEEKSHNAGGFLESKRPSISSHFSFPFNSINLHSPPNNNHPLLCLLLLYLPLTKQPPPHHLSFFSLHLQHSHIYTHQYVNINTRTERQIRFDFLPSSSLSFKRPLCSVGCLLVFPTLLLLLLVNIQPPLTTLILFFIFIISCYKDTIPSRHLYLWSN